LAQGKVVLCDRYADSTLAYQGGGRGFDLKRLSLLNETASGGLKPDLTLLFDLPVEVGLKRAMGRGKGKDRMEREALAFHKRVRKVFLDIAKKEKKRFIVIDASQSQALVYQEVLERLIDRLPLGQGRRPGG
jgi:dTMP kinase